MGAVCRESAAVTWTYKFVPAWIPGHRAAEVRTDGGQGLELATGPNDVNHRSTGYLPPTVALFELEGAAEGRVEGRRDCGGAGVRPVRISGPGRHWIEDVTHDRNR